MRAVTFTLTVLFAVAVAVTEVAPPYTAAAQARDGELRVATFNIHKGADGDDHYDLQRTIEAIASFNADVVALQELDVGFDGPVRAAHPFAEHSIFFTDPAGNHYAVYTPKDFELNRIVSDLIGMIEASAAKAGAARGS